MSQILNRRSLLETPPEPRFPAVHGDGGYAMTVCEVRAGVDHGKPVAAPAAKEFTECRHCRTITSNPCIEAPSKECWEDWADLLADAPGG